MDFKITAFICAITLTLLPGCASKSQFHESASDTLVTIHPDTTIDPVTGLRPGEYIDPESLPKVFTTYDSIQEFNTGEGMLINRYAAIDTTIKLYIYPFDFYDEPKIQDGEELIGVFPQSMKHDLMSYRLERQPFRYNPEMKYSYPPFMGGSEEKWPIFYIKGIELNDVKGKKFPYSFFEPGDSLSIELGERNYTFLVEGKPDSIQYTDWSTHFVRNYRLVLLEMSRGGTNQKLLIGRKFMPFPNSGDISPDFIEWAGDLNNDGYLDVISGDAGKACATYYLWMGASDLQFKLTTRFSGCGC